MFSAGLSARIATLQTQFDLSCPELTRDFMHEFNAQMCRGLEGRRPTSLAMIEAFIPRTSAFEAGTYLGLDLSGTNFRSVLLAIDEDQRIEKQPSVAVFRIPDELKGGGETSSARSGALFEFVAHRIKAFLEAEGIPGRKIQVGFTFAFPTRMTGVSSGHLMKWTKGWNVPDLVGSSPVQALASALDRVGLGNLEVNVLLNDTVGTLVLGYFEDRRTLAGGILGTGTNFAAWLGGVAFNFECGNFDFGPLRSTIQTAVDQELDDESSNPGDQLLEKMVAGRYLGELMRRLIRPHYEVSSLQVPDAILSDDLSSLLAGFQDSSAAKAFFDRLGIEHPSPEDCAFVRSLAAIVMKRSAEISALVVASLLAYVDPELEAEHVITIDGSLFEQAPRYPKMMRTGLRRIFDGKADQIGLKLVKDGSGIGAAVSSAAVEASGV